MQTDYSSLGLKRLGRALELSMKKQKIALRHIQRVSKTIYGAGLNKNTVLSLRDGNTKYPEKQTLQKIAPFIFRVDHFHSTQDDPIGVPVFEFHGAVYTFEKKLELEMVTKVSEFPDFEYRYANWQELVDLMENAPCKFVAPKILAIR